MSDDLNKFKTSISEGLANSSLMDVVITPPSSMGTEDSEFLTFRCESADLPGRGLSLTDRKDYVITSKHPSGMTFTDLNLTFICSSSMKERLFFDKWLELIAGVGERKVSYYDQFISQSIKVNFYKNKATDSKSCSFTFHKIFPSGIATQNISWSTSGLLKLTIAFQYEYWSVEYY